MAQLSQALKQVVVGLEGMLKAAMREIEMIHTTTNIKE